MTDQQQELLARLRLIAAAHDLEEKRQFGGHSFYLHGNMVCCAGKTGMMARVGKDAQEDALKRPHAAPMMRTGRPMGGMVDVSMDGLGDDDVLADWVDLALTFVRTLPPKPGKGTWS